MTSRYQLKGGTFVAYEGGSQPGDIIDQDRFGPSSPLTRVRYLGSLSTLQPVSSTEGFIIQPVSASRGQQRPAQSRIPPVPFLTLPLLRRDEAQGSQSLSPFSAAEHPFRAFLGLCDSEQGPAFSVPLAEAEIPPEPRSKHPWNYPHPSPNPNPNPNPSLDSYPAMEGQDYNQSSEYNHEYPPPPGGYYQQPQQPPQQQQYYAASSSSNNSPGSPSTYQPIYPSVGYAASAPGYGTSQPAAGYGYAQSEGYTHTSASASATLNENEAELKRLRNTAASARFRAKKKKREQSLERQSREKREELQRLENRISELEQENKFLKSLILTPRARKDDDAAEEGEEESGKGKGKEKAHGSGERRGGKGKDGVGTSRH
ncbi:uncharacterized protein LY89DRAFT_718440 [Mollisia scopiformis]|uniref:BZIP domain-containing protein n=1 Tax=Mollisia scopiformis TaxID=149040 RepID=A0A194XCD8_MOLSC|nr:uncharacterized protein LY89DRAFT_718440 [Mollisia scopiformis]KUJ17824.1 hypothetical protein LY89DRAFT_718440 [Mollisia scopiformis]